MRLSVKILAAVCVLAVVVMFGVIEGWFGAKTSKPGPAPGLASNVNSNSTAPGARSNPPTVKAAPIPQVPVVRTSVPPETVQTPAGANPNIITNWEERLEEVLGSDKEESEKAKQLFAMFPRLPEEGQVEVVQHLSNLVADQDYAPLGKLLADPTLPDDVLEQLMADILNRPNSLKLPLLLEVARDARHPKAEDAKDLLELYLEEDYGQDWTKWQAKVQEWVQQNPD